ncbi:hypothetical protein [Pseudoalteromonas sp. OANN1]|uniref:NACHT domain-containing protein n=1 Tax=Pseudoalteromonas sp. OANN1 TaxID=2954497 RepID=UPI0020984DA4|nr:hypothetical protein [Pseudoalteromonas sp. OANN1]MCO7197594.1 hypothetical protein [Pseudoalteromonas sp. OANN1]
MENYINLNRAFALIPENQEKEYQDEWGSFFGSSKEKGWRDVLKEYRCIILAEAGAGKTEEFRQQASNLMKRGVTSFFIRIEDIDSDFEEAFEIGSQQEFREWLDGSGEAWFFLDSVDEARLTNPNAFKKAINRFATCISNAKHRAHIFISSRPYAWRPKEDRSIVENKLYLPQCQNTKEPSVHDGAEAENDLSALTVVMLKPLDSDRVKSYCEARDAQSVDSLLEEIERLNLWALAERPFDLENIIDKWREAGVLGSRIDLLKHNIKSKLTEQHSVDRAGSQHLVLEQALNGARKLAAAVILTDTAGIVIPDSILKLKGIHACEVLSDWAPKDIRALLELGIFNDIIYDTVRFRHREIRELLAAEWFYSLLQSGAGRSSIAALFFKEQYGEQIITPRLRSVLSWLILFDDTFYQQAISIAPEIAVEGGDPAILPLPTREQLLEKIVFEIATNEDGRGARDNSAIARIAGEDLTPKTVELIKEYFDNDDAIFFLGRLVWQGKMVDALALFEKIAQDANRDKYARVASVRAIATLAEPNHSAELWAKLNNSDHAIEQRLLAELLEEACPNVHNVEHLLKSLEVIDCDKRKSDFYSLRNAMDDFICKVTIDNNAEVLNKLLDGLDRLFRCTPFIDDEYCKVSANHAWLISYAALMLEKMIESKCELALSQRALSVLIYISQVKSWGYREYDDYEDSLGELIPKWSALNDALYWETIHQTRTHLQREGQSVTDNWDVSSHNCFWEFDESSYTRLLNSIPSLEFLDDQLVALSTVIRLYWWADKPKKILDELKVAAQTNSSLQGLMQARLGPTLTEISDTQRRLYARRKRQEVVEKKEQQQRQEWIQSLRSAPNQLVAKSLLNNGEISNNIVWLYSEIVQEGLITTRTGGADWQKLIPEFGEKVAMEYREIAQKLWRSFNVPLQSEHRSYINSHSYALIVALAGLEIESRESSAFPHNLSDTELNQALRFLGKELNGFPSWLEDLFKVYPLATTEAMAKEVIWELEYASKDDKVHYILSNILHQAPWVHEAIAPAIFDWLYNNPEKIIKFPEYCVQIMVGGKYPREALVALAKREISRGTPTEIQARWYAMWVDWEAEQAIPELEVWLEGLSVEQAKVTAETFVAYLVGDRSGRGGIGGMETYITPRYLKQLYILAYRFIRAEDDIDRSTGGAYMPGLRDDAQAARHRLFSLLSELPDKAAYDAMKELEQEHPEPNYRHWMKKQAYKRAEADADLEPWSCEQVCQYATYQLVTPRTHKQLFELGVLKLKNMKIWLEQGNDSPWRTWQKAEQENEVRNLVTGWLNQNCRDQYTTAQEPELTNGQRMDIWLNSNYVNAPVPIELKLLDKSWSGNQLCERLRNQLVGDYLRANGASCGVFLLVSANTNKSWQIDNQSVSLDELRDALMNYWTSISKEYPTVSAIEVIVIDLNRRGAASAH